MRIIPIETGLFKLDGGAMFGVVPRTIWQKTNPPDERNLCTWAMRCMLIEIGNRLILVDNGIGNKQDEKFFGHYDLHGNFDLSSSLKQAGYSPDDVTDMMLTHLHFDHCGGGIAWKTDRSGFEPVFRNAKYWVNKAQWDWAIAPNAREKASFLKENILPMQESGHLHLLDQPENFDGLFDLEYTFGHTDGMMLPKLHYKGRTVLYMADLLPSIGHIPLPYVMAYDTRPLLTLDEKYRILSQAAAEDWVLFFEHDAVNECCTIEKTEKGSFHLKEAFPFRAL